MMKKAILAVVALVVLGLAAAVWAGCGGLPKSAVAQVNDKVITKEDLDNAISDLKQQYGDQGFPSEDSPQYSDMQKQVVERLATEEVLWFEADKMGITVSDDEINQQIDQLKQMVGGDDQFNQALSQRNLTIDRLKDNIRKSLLFQKLFAQVTQNAPQVDDAQAQAFYNANPTQFQLPEQRHVLHILVADEGTANSIKAQLDAGADFAALAKQYSTDPSTKDKGGDLGDLSSQNSGMVPEFESAMDALQAGQTSGPVKTQYGYHIIRVTSITPAHQQTFDEAKDQIKQGLLQENQRTAFDNWLSGVKGNYNIQYADDYAPSPTDTTGGLLGPDSGSGSTDQSGQAAPPADQGAPGAATPAPATP